MAIKVPKRIATAVMNSLKGGVVPRVGLEYIAVGRKPEIEALLRDVEIIGDGGASFRFIVGKYGSGKSFLLQTMRNYAMEKGFAVMDADLSPERRLVGSKGQGLATYKELVNNLSTKTRPDGGALSLVLEKWISGLQTQVRSETGMEPTEHGFAQQVEKKIYETVNEIEGMVHGFDFARVIDLYYQAYLQGNDETKSMALRWFRGEYVTKTEARHSLGVGVIITDDDWYEYLKILALFLVKAGYQGLIVLVDELVNLYKIPNSTTRQYNYEKILTIYNDTLQGKAKHIGFLMGGTPQCVEDTRRGLFSYEALRSRLQTGRFATGEMRDMLSPIIRLEPLTHEELLVLVEKLTTMHGDLYGYEPKLTQKELISFLQTELSRVGADTQVTPREIIRDFIELLNILCQNPEKSVEEILGGESFAFAKNEEETVDEAFMDFEL